MPIEEAIVEQLLLRGPCSLDDVVTYLPDFSWGEVFRAIDRMSRRGGVLSYRLRSSTYQIALCPQFMESGSTSGQKRGTR